MGLCTVTWSLPALAWTWIHPYMSCHQTQCSQDPTVSSTSSPCSTHAALLQQYVMPAAGHLTPGAHAAQDPAPGVLPAM